MTNFWEIKASSIPKTVDIYIYSNIKGDSYDWYGNKKISETSGNAFREKLASCGELDSINLYVNSLGGSVYEALSIYNQLKRHPANKTAYVDGFCCSAATLPVLACDTVIMPKNTLMMIHNAWIVAIGNSTELKKAADDLEVVNNTMCEIYLSRKNSSLSDEALIKMLDDETFISATDCVKYGFADKFADYDADMEKAKEQLKGAEDEVSADAPYVERICARLDKIVADISPIEQEKPQPSDGIRSDIGVIAEMAASFYAALKK